MGHLYHGYVSHNQPPIVAAHSPMLFKTLPLGQGFSPEPRHEPTIASDAVPRRLQNFFGEELIIGACPTGATSSLIDHYFYVISYHFPMPLVMTPMARHGVTITESSHWGSCPISAENHLL